MLIAIYMPANQVHAVMSGDGRIVPITKQDGSIQAIFDTYEELKTTLSENGLKIGKNQILEAC